MYNIIRCFDIFARCKDVTCTVYTVQGVPELLILHQNILESAGKIYPYDVPLPNKLGVANNLEIFQTWKQVRISNDENN